MGQAGGKKPTPEAVTGRGVMEYRVVRMETGRLERCLRSRRHVT